MAKRFFLLSQAIMLLGMEPAVAGCPPDGYSRHDLVHLKQIEFDIAAPERNGLAVALLDCLADPDPEIRDGIVYEGLATWLRSKLLESATIDAMYGRLQADLAGNGDADGFLQPFAALVLSEVARTDRTGDSFIPERREALVEAAASYMTGINDYRGFSETEGWRHGVAHGADLVLQLVLNEHIDATQVDRLVTAVLTQVAPAGEIFYIYGEPNRLARAVYYARSRDVVDHKRWQEWLQAVSDPEPFAQAQQSVRNQAACSARRDGGRFEMAGAGTQ